MSKEIKGGRMSGKTLFDEEELTPEAYDLGSAIGKFDKIYAPKREKKRNEQL